MKKYIKLSVVLLCVAVFATFSSCTKEYQLKHNATLKELVGTWECVWSATFDVYNSGYPYYSYSGAPFDGLFGLDYDVFSWYNYYEGFVPENYYVGMTWKFDEPVRHFFERGYNSYDVEGEFTIMMKGQTYAGSYSLRFFQFSNDDPEDPDDYEDCCHINGLYFLYDHDVQNVMGVNSLDCSNNSMTIRKGNKKIFTFKKIS